jgi:hypothetical protein
MMGFDASNKRDHTQSKVAKYNIDLHVLSIRSRRMRPMNYMFPQPTPHASICCSLEHARAYTGSIPHEYTYDAYSKPTHINQL